MRWFVQLHQHNDTRQVERFLLLPHLIGGEWRWFERARWLQTYVFNEWQDTKWLD